MTTINARAMTFDEVTAALAARWGFELPAEWLEEAAVTFFLAPILRAGGWVGLDSEYAVMLSNDEGDLCSDRYQGDSLIEALLRLYLGENMGAPEYADE